jgi:hypothetical protein
MSVTDTTTISAPIMFRDDRDARDARRLRQIRRLKAARELERARRLQIGNATFQQVNAPRRATGFSAVLSSLARLCRSGFRQES